MNRAVKVYLPAVILIAGLTWLFMSSSLKDPQYVVQPSVSMPWHIEPHADGTATVFNITLETTTLDEVLQRLGVEYELAIISDRQDNSGLEVYYSNFATGPITGKLIARVEADADTLLGMQERAIKSEYLDTGSRRFHLSPEDHERARPWPIISLSLVPSATLDAEVVQKVFGQPAERLSSQEGTEHFLYPDRGLEVIVNEKGKEVLQYVAPRNFERLVAPLRQLQDAQPEPAGRP